jgi:hypothetical protein
VSYLVRLSICPASWPARWIARDFSHVPLPCEIIEEGISVTLKVVHAREGYDPFNVGCIKRFGVPLLQARQKPLDLFRTKLLTGHRRNLAANEPLSFAS